MARENWVYLYGRVKTSPVITYNPDKTPKKAKIIIDTVRRTSATKDLLLKGEMRWECLCVTTKHQKTIRDKIEDIKEGDMIEVKGSLCTYEQKKKFICPHCGATLIRDGVVIYVDPIFIKRCETGLEKNDAIRMVVDCDEISNQIKIMGTLCREPRIYVDEETKKTECDFQIASNRNRHILEDDPDKRTDYPWVKSFGAAAEEYYEALHVNSTVYIDGALQSRAFEREFVCEVCGELFKDIDRSTEIIPYNLEYLKNCDLPLTMDEIEDYELESEDYYGE